MMFEIEDNYSINLNQVESVRYNPNTRSIHIKMINNSYYDIEDVNMSYYRMLIRHINEVIK